MGLLNACLKKNNLELRISLRQTNIRVQYLSTITLVDFEFSKKSTDADSSHFYIIMRLLFSFFSRIFPKLIGVVSSFWAQKFCDRV